MKTRIKIKFAEAQELLGSEPFEFPKYATQLLNLANNDCHGTRPEVVGKMTELIQEFSGKTIHEWEHWYLEKHPDAIQKATLKIREMIEKFKAVLNQADDELISNWVKDLVIFKTFVGLKTQEAILAKSAKLLKTTYRLATPEEESKGIDGYLGNTPVSVKPVTYKLKQSLQERITAPIIFYEKVKEGFVFELEEIVKYF